MADERVGGAVVSSAEEYNYNHLGEDAFIKALVSQHVYDVNTHKQTRIVSVSSVRLSTIPA